MLFIEGATTTLASASATPMMMPPSSAPAMEPSPPMMTMVKASRVKAGPRFGVASAVVAISEPAAPTQARPMPKVSA